jgi:hypothetical protein
MLYSGLLQTPARVQAATTPATQLLLIGCQTKEREVAGANDERANIFYL